jgi:predicted anti-sigma-YlaC factor YlaD
MTDNHPREDLGAYALMALDEPDRRTVESHLAACRTCRDEYEELRTMTDLLGELPPEALLEGPPEDGDLLLQRTLGAVRRERVGEVTRRRWLAGAAASVAAIALLGGGVLAGRQSVDLPPVAVPTVTATATSTTLPGTFTVDATDATTGAQLSARVVPAAGWVRVNAQVKGIAAGQRCRVVVVAKDGRREVAGSWLVSPAGAANGTTLDGSAIVAPDQVASIAVENEEGAQFVSAVRA